MTIETKWTEHETNYRLVSFGETYQVERQNELTQKWNPVSAYMDKETAIRKISA